MGMLLQYHKEVPKPEKEVKKETPKEVTKETKEVEIKKRKREV